MIFRFAQISDTHNSNLTAYANALLDDIPYLDFKCHTGDIVQNYFEQGISNAGFDSHLVVLGNHDMLLQSGVNPIQYDWTKQPTQAQAYNLFFNPYKAQTGITIPNNTSWWFKDFDDKAVRVIGLNCHVLGDAKTTQATWLEATLSEVIVKNYKVVILSHIAPDLTKSVLSTFTDLYEPEHDSVREAHSFIQESRTIIDDYISNGGNIICGLYGHEHCDLFLNNSGVPEFVIGSTVINNYNNVQRTNNTTSSVVVNLYEYDDFLQTLKVWRLGAGDLKNGRFRKLLTWSYNKKEIISYVGLPNKK